jgi:predicted aldo/keto reductase-like oxidoreductase
MLRRQFIKNLALGSCAALWPDTGRMFQPQTRAGGVKKGNMFYRRLGRTDLRISEISLGGSPLPDRDLLFHIIERGVNYIDSSVSYGNGNCERQIGRLLKEIGRDKIYFGTKFHIREEPDEKAIIDSVNGSLRRLGTETIDVLLIHGAEKAEHLTDERLVGAFEKLKREGKYRFRGLSCHSNHFQVIKKAVDCGYYDMVQLGYNVFDIEGPEKNVESYDDYLGESGTSGLVALAKSKDVGLIAMKTLKVGGRRQNLDRYKTGTTSIFQAMLKWVLENRNVTSALTEILTYDQMEEDLSVAGVPLSDDERATLYRYVAQNCRDYCRFCGTCQRRCPSGIKTTDVMRFLAYQESYAKTRLAKDFYSGLRPDQTALACDHCGICDEVCPYGVSVQRRLLEAHRILSA